MGGWISTESAYHPEDDITYDTNGGSSWASGPRGNYALRTDLDIKLSGKKPMGLPITFDQTGFEPPLLTNLQVVAAPIHSPSTFSPHAASSSSSSSTAAGSSSSSSRKNPSSTLDPDTGKSGSSTPWAPFPTSTDTIPLTGNKTGSGSSKKSSSSRRSGSSKRAPSISKGSAPSPLPSNLPVPIDRLLPLPDLKYFLATSSVSSIVMVYSTATGSPVSSLVGHSKPITTWAVAEKSALVITGSEDASLRLWSCPGGSCKAVVSTPHKSPIRDVAFWDSVGSFVAADDGEDIIVFDRLGSIRITIPLADPSERVGHLAVAPRSARFLYSSDRNPVMHLYTTEHGSNEVVFERTLTGGHREPVSAIAVVESNGTSWVSASLDGLVLVWDVDSLGGPAAKFNIHNIYFVTELLPTREQPPSRSATPSKPRGSSGGDEAISPTSVAGRLRARSSASNASSGGEGMLVGTTRRMLYAAHAIAIHDSRFAAIALGKGFIVVDLHRRRRILSALDAHAGAQRVTGIGWMFGGSRVVTSDNRGRLRLWAAGVNTGRSAPPTGKSAGMDQPVLIAELSGHTGAVNGMTVATPHVLVSGGDDGLLLLWRDAALASEIASWLTTASLVSDPSSGLTNSIRAADAGVRATAGVVIADKHWDAAEVLRRKRGLSPNAVAKVLSNKGVPPDQVQGILSKQMELADARELAALKSLV